MFKYISFTESWKFRISFSSLLVFIIGEDVLSSGSYSMFSQYNEQFLSQKIKEIKIGHALILV